MIPERALREMIQVALVIERLQRSAVRAEQAFRGFGAAVRRAKISLYRRRVVCADALEEQED